MASPGLFCDVEVMEDLGILPARATTSAPLPCQSNPPHHILVAEDDIFFRQLNTEVLLQSGYAVDSAEDGAAAWDALNADRYDLLITDHNMPKVSGVELLQKLQAAHMPLPVIMVTATVPQEEFTRDPSLQPAATLLKPYPVAELLRTVKKVLREAVSRTDDARLVASSGADARIPD